MNTTTVPRSGQARINHKRRQRAAFWSAAAEQTVWDGARDQWGSPRQSLVTEWIKANGIDPHTVAVESPITVGTMGITYTEIRRNAQGRPFVDGRGRRAVEVRTVPLLVPFLDPAATR